MSSVARPSAGLTQSLALCLLLALNSGAASAHGGGGASHSSGMSTLHAPSASSLSPAVGMSSTPGSMSLAHPALPASATTTSRSHGTSPGAIDTTTAMPLPPTVSTTCETDEGANCEAKIESYSTVTQGDPNPIWTAPVPTTIPPTPAAPQIVEPATQTGPILEESGGAAQVDTTGGGPTLADCMSLWDKDVHMTKALWKTVCVRTMNGINEPSEGLGLSTPKAQQHAPTPRAPTPTIAHN